MAVPVGAAIFYKNMDLATMKKRANKIAQKSGFVLQELIYSGTYYSKDNIRNLIYEGLFENKPAILKLYDDERMTDEPLALQRFHKSNRSRILRAPELYAYEVDSARRGWFIMEKLPDGGAFMEQPMSSSARKEFLKVYLEYREYFPREPQRPLTMVEKLPVSDFHLHRISRWFELASISEAELVRQGGAALLEDKTFLPLYKQARQKIAEYFSGKSMVWCHGHFKPHEIYKISGKNQYYLIDFAHNAFYPEGYELAFMIWADYLVSADPNLSYHDWRQGIEAWLQDLGPVVKKLKLHSYEDLLKKSLIERLLGTILADVVAADRPRDEKLKRLHHLQNFLKELV